MAPSTVLRVVVENLVYPVTLDALCQVNNINNTSRRTLNNLQLFVDWTFL